MSKLERLIAGLDAANVKKYGRNKKVAEATGYSQGMVAKVLSGHVTLTDKFILSVCSAFYIRREWVYEGVGPIGNTDFDVELAQEVAREKEKSAQHKKDELVAVEELERGLDALAASSGGYQREQVEGQQVRRLISEGRLEEMRTAEAELSDLVTRQKKIQSNFEKYRELIIAFLSIPVEDMEEALFTLRLIQVEKTHGLVPISPWDE